MAANSSPVVISGAGPVGLALAVGLAHHGIRSLVLEDDPALSRHSKAPGIHARTLEVFRAWGVIDRFMAEGEFLRQPQLWVAGMSEPQATVDLSVLADRTAYPGVMLLPQDRTEALLYERLKELGMSEVRFGHRLTSFEAGPAGVTVEVAPPSGASYRLDAEYLVGCDGAHSMVRECLGWHLEGKTYPSRFMLADVRLHDERAELPWPRMAPVPRGLLVGLRLQPQLWRIIATVLPKLDEAHALAPEQIDRHVTALFGPGPFEEVWKSLFHVHCRTSPHFRLGRVLLAGDAAHLNSPAGGQGMNSGIHDAHNLAWKLARALSGGNADALLDSYEAERRPAILTGVDRYTDLLTRAVLWPMPRTRSALAKVVRRALAHPAFVSRVAPRATMLDVHYEHSPLLSGQGPWIGARAPDGELRDADGQGRRLLDLAGREAALLLFDDHRLPAWDRGAIARRLHDLPGLTVHVVLPTDQTAGPGEWRDATGALWNAWRASGSTAALVRPDGHVGWMAERPSESELVNGIRQALGG
ncbi:MAG TPA: FAD-dependent monooxygenase [Stenomitos sp.]